jgi:hypothetical protein
MSRPEKCPRQGTRRATRSIMPCAMAASDRGPLQDPRTTPARPTAAT